MQDCFSVQGVFGVADLYNAHNANELITSLLLLERCTTEDKISVLDFQIVEI